MFLGCSIVSEIVTGDCRGLPRLDPFWFCVLLVSAGIRHMLGCGLPFLGVVLSRPMIRGPDVCRETQCSENALAAAVAASPVCA